MNYELCKKLRDAGFTDARVWGKTPFDEIVPEPTLEELIKACGEGFGVLSLGVYENDGTEEYPKKIWIACSTTNTNENPLYKEGVGQSPSEAVANLWLALNQPVHNSTSK